MATVVRWQRRARRSRAGPADRPRARRVLGLPASAWIVGLAAALALGAIPPSARPAVGERDEPRLFTVRGRWSDPRALTYRVEPEGAPVGAEVFGQAIERAVGLWAASGAVALRPAQADEDASVVLGWRHGDHAGCPPFGLGFGVAHAGPVQAGTFVHFDSSRAWSLDGSAPGTLSLGLTAAHELGHILGLDHTPDAVALLSPEGRVDAPAACDLAGLHSLYGGGTDGPGDLVILPAADGEGEAASSAETEAEAEAETETETAPPVLRGVAPSGRCAFLLFDTDGDGDHELLVWDTAGADLGWLMIYHFGPGARLQRTVGPMLGAVPPEASTSFRVGADGRRWIVSRFDGDGRRVRGFDDGGWLTEPSPLDLHGLDLEAAAAAPAPERTADGDEQARGDLDGDGRAELVVRRRASR